MGEHTTSSEQGLSVTAQQLTLDSEFIRVLYLTSNPDEENVFELLREAHQEFLVVSRPATEDVIEEVIDHTYDCIVATNTPTGPRPLDIIEFIRQQDCHTPFVVYTSNFDDSDAGELFDYSAVDFIQKHPDDRANPGVIGERVKHITQQYRDTQQDKNELAKTRNILNTVSKCVFHVSHTGEIYDVTEAVEDEFGYDHETIDTHSFLDFVHPADVGPVLEQLKLKPPEGHDSVSANFQIAAESGEWQHIDAIFHRFSSGESIQGVLIDIQDISPYSRSYSPDVATEESVIEHLPDGVFVLDVDGTIQYANRTWADLLKVSRDELIGVRLSDVVTPGVMNPEILADMEAAIDNIQSHIQGDAEQTEFSASTPTEQLLTRTNSADGAERTYSIHIQPVPDNPDSIIGVVRDITEQIAALPQEQTDSDHVDEFASLISHDLRNPLSVAFTRCELISRETETEHVEDVIDSLERMDQIIDDVLELANSQDAIHSEDSVTLESLATDCWQQVDQHEATLSVTGGFSFDCDRSKMANVFENLYRNAIEHGGDSVSVEVGPLPDESGFYIQDDGPGIPDGKEQQIFEQGYTGGGGTGLGLAIVETIVSGHGWEISAQNGSTGGARFEIRR
jgi:PAS domain S-box-containing protein